MKDLLLLCGRMLGILERWNTRTSHCSVPSLTHPVSAVLQNRAAGVHRARHPRLPMANSGSSVPIFQYSNVPWEGGLTKN